MPARKISDTDLAKALRLREEEGWSCRRIGHHLGVSTGAIYWHCLIHGADKPTAKPLRTRAGPMVMKRGNHVVRRFTPAEDEQLQHWACEGLSNTEIGRRLSRKSHSIRARLATLARHEERAMREAAE